MLPAVAGVGWDVGGVDRQYLAQRRGVGGYIAELLLFLYQVAQSSAKAAKIWSNSS